MTTSPHHVPILLRCSIPILAMSLVMPGCGSGTQRARATDDNLARNSADIGARSGEIDDALLALTTLTDDANGNRNEGYAAFTANVERVRGLSRDIDTQSKELTVRSEEYFKKWEADNAQIEDQAIRATSVERRSDLQRRFADVTNAYQDTKRSLQPFVANLSDIARYLGNDLSTTGVGNIAPAAAKAKSQGADVKRDLVSVRHRLDELSKAMDVTGKL